jgi:hypothetical protein
MPMLGWLIFAELVVAMIANTSSTPRRRAETTSDYSQPLVLYENGNCGLMQLCDSHICCNIFSVFLGMVRELPLRLEQRERLR